MSKRAIFLIAAAVAAIPALVLFANLIWFAFLGVGFLSESSSKMMHDARVDVAYLSSVLAIAITLFGITNSPSRPRH